MVKVNSSTIENYKEALGRDPNSKVFAALADAYREIGFYDEALRVAHSGIDKHPKFASGHLTLGRIYLAQNQFSEALDFLQTSTQLDAQNILAQQLLGECHLALGHGKDALKCFKLVLFLSPNNEKAKKAIERLESLTADEYEDEVFAMEPLKNSTLAPHSSALNSPVASALKNENFLLRKLSLLDAFIVRNDFDKARHLIKELSHDYSEHQELRSRMDFLEMDDEEALASEKITPIASREKQIIDKKVKRLQFLLHRIKSI